MKILSKFILREISFITLIMLYKIALYKIYSNTFKEEKLYSGIDF